jgi:hypothetical protein
MRFNVSSTKLFEQLQAVTRTIAAKNSLQILESILYDLNGEMLTLSSSDLLEVDFDFKLRRSDVRIARNYMTRTTTIEMEESKPNHQVISTLMEIEKVKVEGQSNATYLGEIPQWFYDHNRICVLEKQMSEIHGKVAQIDYRVGQLEEAPKSMAVDTLLIKHLQYSSSELAKDTPLPTIKNDSAISDESDVVPLCEYIVEDSVKTDSHYGYGYGETPNERQKIERTRIETYNRELINLVKGKKYASLAKACRSGESKGHLDFKGQSKYDVGRSFQKLCPDVIFKIDSFSSACYQQRWQPK